jgi:hypothetical protein
MYVVSDLQIAGDTVEDIKREVFEVGRHSRSIEAVRNIGNTVKRVGNPRLADNVTTVVMIKTKRRCHWERVSRYDNSMRRQERLIHVSFLNVTE